MVAGDIIAAMRRHGIRVDTLRPAAVDARGSVPWVGEGPDGPVFVKALSSEQRTADLLFRGLRWLRLRRAGDARPETSLRRSGEHEAFVSHHARLLGVATPTLLAVVDLDGGGVGLVYEGLRGAPAPAPNDAVMDALLRRVVDCRAATTPRRAPDLRLANVFLRDDGGVALVDFGSGELAASDQLLNTDVAELLAATAPVVGVDRAVDVAVEEIGAEAVGASLEWLQPLGLGTATRQAVRRDNLLEALRSRIQRTSDVAIADHEPLGRLAPERVIGAGLAIVGVYSLLTIVADDQVVGRLGDLATMHLWLAVVAEPLPWPQRAPRIVCSLAVVALSRRRKRSGRLPASAATAWSWAAHDDRAPRPARRGSGHRRASSRWAQPA